jgi:UMF1 family MFS transporter
LALSGVVIAGLAPVLGALADGSGRRMPWIVGFSCLYVIGAAGLWIAAPGAQNALLVLALFGLGLIGMEFATIFTNAMLPDLGPRREVGRISGTGWAVGYAGGVVALILMLCFLAENEVGTTLLGLAPAFGLDPEMREGTRSVGPFVAFWYLVFIIPFFAWVREEPSRASLPLRDSLAALWQTLKSLPRTPSLTAYLASSMFYRDALNGMYTFGGIYALGVLGWSVVSVGVFGIVAAISGALFAWMGGFADRAFGPKRVISFSILVLTIVGCAIITIAPDRVMGVRVPEGSALPSIAFYVCGALIGGAGGSLQAASRTMMVYQARPDRMTEGFGLYGLAGKATAFLAPFLIAVVTDISGSQRAGLLPLIGLFLCGLFLLRWVKSDEDASRS